MPYAALSNARYCLARASLGLWDAYRRGRFARPAFEAAVAMSLAFQEDFHRAPREWAAKFQRRRLRRVIALALRTKAYCDIWGKEGFPLRTADLADSFGKLPVTDKRNLRGYGLDGLTAHPMFKGRATLGTTSGSTGEPFRFAVDAKFFPWRMAAYFRTFLLQGWGLEWYKIHVQSPWSHPKPWGVPSRAKTFPFPKLFDESARSEVADFFRRNKADILEGFPSQLLRLSEILRASGIEVKFKGILSYGEQLYPAERLELERAFGGKVASAYGLNEYGIVGSECEARDGFHSNEFSHILEIVDDAGRSVAVGNRGRVVVTPFWNDIMPLVRYDTGDMGALIKEPCACGRRTPRLILEGRRDDVLELEGGRAIHSSSFHPIFYKFAGAILRYQVAYAPGKEPQVRVVAGENYSAETERALRRELEYLFGPATGFSIVRVSDTPPAPSGKFKAILRMSE